MSLSNPEDWSANQRQRYCLEEEVRTTKHVVVRTLAGELISESHTPKVSTKVQPNLDAIRQAHRDGLDLPFGVQVRQEYAIRTKRIYGKQLDPQTSVDPGIVPDED